MRLLTVVALLLLTWPVAANERDDAIAAYAGAFRGFCDWDFGAGEPPQFTPQVYEMTFTASWDPESGPKDIRLYRFFCTQGAYNSGHVYLTATDDDGVRIVYFANPTISASYGTAADGSPDDTVVKSIRVIGMGASPLLINSEVNAEAGTITSSSHWRGIGDASSIGSWTLIDGDFSLQSYDVDASYDGSVDHVRLYESGTEIPVTTVTP